MADPADNPGVRVPPPLFYAAAVIGGWLIDREWPLPIGGPLRHAVAWMLFAAFLLLFASAVGSFRRRRTSVFPFRPATTFVIAGPYRFTRNPMYLGAAALVLAFALWLNTWWPMLFLVPALVTIQRYVIAREESYMRRRFGAEYEEYIHRVRRWL